MVKTNKSKYIMLSIILPIAAFLIITSTLGKSNNMPIATNHALSVIDRSNYKELAGFMDYVFIAEVNENIETEYKDRFTNQETIKADGIEIPPKPYTKYKVTVLENLKGNLITNEPIEIIKNGGISNDNTHIELFENDKLPEEGNVYIFFATVDHDNSLLISGSNSNILLDSNKNLRNKNSLDFLEDEYIEKHNILEHVLDGVENEIPFERDRGISVYENN